MTLDEAIIHCEEVADRCDVTDGNIKCANEHRQLARWLKDYKRLLKESEGHEETHDEGISKSIATAFQFGLAMGFVKKCDELCDMNKDGDRKQENMTNEERDKAIRTLQWFHDNDFLFRSTGDFKHAAELAIQALKQESVLNKIREEIEQYIDKEKLSLDGQFDSGLNLALKIIDKYMAEREDV